jgi:hypothetical protein
MRLNDNETVVQWKVHFSFVVPECNVDREGGGVRHPTKSSISEVDQAHIGFWQNCRGSVWHNAPYGCHGTVVKRVIGQFTP